MSKQFLPMSKNGLKLDALKNSLGIKEKRMNEEMCEIYIKGSESMILKMFGFSGGEERRADYCG